MKRALPVSGKVDRIERLHRDPPAQWDRTAWAVVEEDGEKIMREHAVIECPNCSERAYWTKGFVGCSHCDTKQPLRG